MLLNNTKDKKNNLLFFLFNIIFIIQFFNYFFEEYQHIHIIILTLETLVIIFYLIFSKKDNNKSLIVLFFLFYYVVSIFLSLISRLVIGLSFNVALSSMMTDFTGFLMMILYYYVIVKNPVKYKDVEILLIAYLYFALLSILYALIFQAGEISLVMKASNPYASNLGSFFGNRNNLGYFLFNFISIYLIQNSFYKNKVGSFFYYLILGSSFLLLTLTLSRTSIISTLIFLFLFIMNKFYEVLIKDKYSIKKLLIINILIVLSILAIIMLKNNYSFIDFLTNKIIRKQYQTSGRNIIWEIGIQNWKENKLFGIGSFQASTTIDLNAFHNTIIEILVRNGLIGLIIKSIVILSLITYYFKYTLKTNRGKRYMFSYLISIFFSMQFESRFLFKIGFREFLLMFTIFILGQQITPKNNGKYLIKDSIEKK